MVMPYLHFNGNCEEAFKFYEEAFNGKITHLSRLNNDPNNKVMHAAVMLSETGGVSGGDQDEPVQITGMEILVLLPSRERIEDVLSKLSVGGTIVSGFHPHPPPDDNGGGAYVIDKYGYSWFLCLV